LLSQATFLLAHIANSGPVPLSCPSGPVPLSCPGPVPLSCPAFRSLAKLARTEPKTQWPCKAGSAKGTIHWMAPDFDAPLEEFKEYME
jgi:Protein of unknown function (DUF2281)